MLAPPDDYAKEAAAFLTAWPQSIRRVPLRMRLGEMYFRRQNFAGARQQFEQLAKDDPLHPMAEAALFWAGKSALLSLGATSGDDAIALWEQVYKRGGPLKLEARLQVALLKQRRNDFAGALQLIDNIMESKPPPDAGMRRHVFCARGEILVAQNASPQLVAEGLASFDQLVSDPGMPREWRHEAMVRKGACLEQLKRTDEALEAWHAVLSDPPAAEGEDDYWYHRAGEKALRLLESRQRYEEAVTIAEKMALAPGTRGKIAAELVNQLALKYGIWREMKPQP
jgi:tetratricopeptide (TPR) repeat protein